MIIDDTLSAALSHSAAAHSAASTERLTKREIFAALALQGVLASPHTGDWSVEEHVALAVQSADMLLAALTYPPSSLGRVDPCP